MQTEFPTMSSGSGFLSPCASSMSVTLRRVGYAFTPILLFSVFLLLATRGGSPLPDFGVPFQYQGKPVAWYLIQAGLWLSAGWLLIRLSNMLLWDGLVARAIGGRVPGLIKTVSAVVIASLAVTGVVGVVFGLPITGFFATSGVVGIVVGFALRNMINDVFTGMALNIDRPFKIGDWVTVHTAGHDVVGQVSEINWRTTRIRTEDNNVVILPNGALGLLTVTNHWGGGREGRFETGFTLDTAVPTDRARRILLGAVRAVAGVSGVLDKPEPQVLVAGTSDAGVVYHVRYWMRPWEASSPSAGQDAVIRSVLAHLQQAGISTSYPKEEVLISRAPSRALDSVEAGDREALLTRVRLFHDLSAEELRFLAGRMRRREFARGTVIFRQGDQGSSMFVLVEGLLSSAVQAREGNEVLRAAQFVPGDFFGEFSLLTGDGREATVSAVIDSVAFEITKVDVDELCSRRPQLVEILATALVDRMVDISKVVEQAEKADENPHADRGSVFLVRRVKSMFQGVFPRGGK